MGSRKLHYHKKSQYRKKEMPHYSVSNVTTYALTTKIKSFVLFLCFEKIVKRKQVLKMYTQACVEETLPRALVVILMKQRMRKQCLPQEVALPGGGGGGYSHKFRIGVCREGS